MKLLLARKPGRLNAKHPLIIEEFLELASDGNVEGLGMMIEMLKDLHVHGRDSRYLIHMTGTPIWELKSRSRGGEKGGSRVYLFLTENDEAAVVNCEVKEGDTASTQKLKVVLQVITAYRAGIPVFATPRGEQP